MQNNPTQLTSMRFIIATISINRSSKIKSVLFHPLIHQIVQNIIKSHLRNSTLINKIKESALLQTNPTFNQGKSSFIGKEFKLSKTDSRKKTFSLNSSNKKSIDSLPSINNSKTSKCIFFYRPLKNHLIYLLELHWNPCINKFKLILSKTIIQSIPIILKSNIKQSNFSFNSKNTKKSTLSLNKTSKNVSINTKIKSHHSIINLNNKNIKTTTYNNKFLAYNNKISTSNKSYKKLLNKFNLFNFKENKSSKKCHQILTSKICKIMEEDSHLEMISSKFMGQILWNNKKMFFWVFSMKWAFRLCLKSINKQVDSKVKT